MKLSLVTSLITGCSLLGHHYVMSQTASEICDGADPGDNICSDISSFEGVEIRKNGGGVNGEFCYHIAIGSNGFFTQYTSNLCNENFVADVGTFNSYVDSKATYSNGTFCNEIFDDRSGEIIFVESDAVSDLELTVCEPSVCFYRAVALIPRGNCDGLVFFVDEACRLIESISMIRSSKSTKSPKNTAKAHKHADGSVADSFDEGNSYKTSKNAKANGQCNKCIQYIEKGDYAKALKCIDELKKDAECDKEGKNSDPASIQDKACSYLQRAYDRIEAEYM